LYVPFGHPSPKWSSGMSDGVMREPERISIDVADPFGPARAPSVRFARPAGAIRPAATAAPWWAVLLIAVAGLAGWVLFGLAFGAKNEQVVDLQVAVAEARGEQRAAAAERDRLKAELDRLRSTWGELARMEAQLNAARQENARLGEMRERLLADVSRATAATQDAAADPPAADRLPRESLAALLEETQPPSRSEIEAAQRALARLGFGRLPVDGEIGRRTRRAIQAFERRQGLPVTGELGPATLEALARATGEPIDRAAAER
jgi:uncharacterized protein with PIN domain